MHHFLFGTHLEEEENIHYIAHKHIFTILTKIYSIGFFGVVLPLIFFFIFPPLKFIWIGWLFFGSIKMTYTLADWYFDAWLITDLSIIDVEWKGIFDKSSTRIEYTALKGVSYNIRGFWETILNYGDIQLEIFISNSTVTLEKSSKPKKVERAILDAQGLFTNSKALSEHESLKSILTSLIEKESAK